MSDLTVQDTGRTATSQATHAGTHQDLEPKFIYSYGLCTSKLYMTNLRTAEQSCIVIPSFRFLTASCWSELPGGVLLFTGGDQSREAVSIGTLKEFAVVRRRPMLTERREHGTVYYAAHLYALGGAGPKEECERYVCAEDRWEPLLPLPVACENISCLVLEDCLYALGGGSTAVNLDLIQKLDFTDLTWTVLGLRLPSADMSLAVFKTSAVQAYFIIGKELYSFLPSQQSISLVKTLPSKVRGWYGPSYFSLGVLYTSTDYEGPYKLPLTL
jgi:hypothetical protein